MSCVKLLNLLELFASPRFLFARPGNHAYAGQLMEALNNMVQYQYESNAQLVYALIRRRDLFARLAGLTVESWRTKQGGGGTGRKGNPAKPAAPAVPVRAVLPFRPRGGSKPSASPSSQSLASMGGEPASSGGGGAEPAALLAPVDGVDNSEWVTRNARAASSGSAAAAPIESVAPVSVVTEAVATVGSAPESAAAGADGVASSTSPGPSPADSLPSTAEASAAAVEATSPPAAAAAPSPPKPAGPWEPTEAWLEGTVKKAMSLGTITRLVTFLSPQLERFVAETGASEDACIDFLRASTVVGVLPQPHPIVQRIYQPNDYTSLWFSTFTWSTIYLACAKTLPLFDAGAIKLFQITVSAGPGAGA